MSSREPVGPPPPLEPIGFNFNFGFFGGGKKSGGYYGNDCGDIPVTTACAPKPCAPVVQPPCVAPCVVNKQVRLYSTVKRFGDGCCPSKCVKPAPPPPVVVCEPPVEDVPAPCHSEPIPSCKPVFRTPCKWVPGQCIPPLPECPTFQMILQDLVLQLSLVALHTNNSGQSEQQKLASVADLKATIEHLNNKLGPDFGVVFEPVVDALVQVAEARLGQKADDVRQALLEIGEETLGRSDHELANYFGSMKELCGNDQTVCCIREGWQTLIDQVRIMVEALEEIAAAADAAGADTTAAAVDQDAFNQSVLAAHAYATRFGIYLDSLCLAPKPPCPSISTPEGPCGDGVAQKPDKESKLLIRRSNNKATQTPAPPPVAAATTPGAFASPSRRSPVAPLQPRTPAAAAAEALEDEDLFFDVDQEPRQQLFQQQPNSRIGAPLTGSQAQELETRFDATPVVELSKLPDPKFAADLRLDTQWYNASSGRYSAWNQLDESAPRPITEATLHNAEGKAVIQISSRTPQQQRQDSYRALKTSDATLDVGRFSVGDNLTWDVDPGDPEYYEWPVVSSEAASLDIKFGVIVNRVSQNRERAVQRPRTRGAAAAAASVVQDVYAFKLVANLDPLNVAGVYTSPQQASGDGENREVFARVTITGTDASKELPGAVNQEYYAVSKIEVFILDAQKQQQPSPASPSAQQQTPTPSPPKTATRGGRGRGERGRGRRGTAAATAATVAPRRSTRQRVPTDRLSPSSVISVDLGALRMMNEDDDDYEDNYE